MVVDSLRLKSTILDTAYSSYSHFYGCLFIQSRVKSNKHFLFAKVVNCSVMQIYLSQIFPSLNYMIQQAAVISAILTTLYDTVGCRYIGHIDYIVWYSRLHVYRPYWLHCMRQQAAGISAILISSLGQWFPTGSRSWPLFELSHSYLETLPIVHSSPSSARINIK